MAARPRTRQRPQGWRQRKVARLEAAEGRKTGSTGPIALWGERFRKASGCVGNGTMRGPRLSTWRLFLFWTSKKRLEPSVRAFSASVDAYRVLHLCGACTPKCRGVQPHVCGFWELTDISGGFSNSDHSCYRRIVFVAGGLSVVRIIATIIVGILLVFIVETYTEVDAGVTDTLMWIAQHGLAGSYAVTTSVTSVVVGTMFGP